MPLDAYFANGTNYETVRLIALSDRVLGRDSNYDVLFDSAVEAIRDDPGGTRGVADVFWEFLMQRPLRDLKHCEAKVSEWWKILEEN